MSNQWSNELQDLQDARSILQRYLSDYTYEEFVEEAMEATELDKPVWLEALEYHFWNKYGYAKGCDVMAKVVTRSLLQFETIH